MRSPRSASRLAVWVVALLGTGLVSCTSAAAPEGGAPASAGGSGAAVTTLATVAPADTVAWVPAPSGGRQLLDGFQEVTVHVRQPDGTTRDVCLLLAADEQQRERGLMFVTDPALGGHGGMLFSFPQDDKGAFWMKDTVLPLSIAYLATDGHLVSTTDMDPCPAGTANCPTYPAAAPYRYAVEVPKGRLDAIGLTDGATVTVGEASCT